MNPLILALLAGARRDDVVEQAAIGRASTVLGAEGAPCGCPWGICPACHQALTSSGGRCWCTSVECVFGSGHRLTGATWAADEREPCPDQATVKVSDPYGGVAWMCRAHAELFESMSKAKGGT